MPYLDDWNFIDVGYQSYKTLKTFMIENRKKTWKKKILNPTLLRQYNQRFSRYLKIGDYYPKNQVN